MAAVLVRTARPQVDRKCAMPDRLMGGNEQRHHWMGRGMTADKVLTVGQAREAGGARNTLEKIHFTPEQAIVSVFAAPLAQSTSPPQPAVAGTSTPVPPVQPGSTPTPASLADQQPWDGDLTDLNAFYSLDGDMWRLMANNSYREGPEVEGCHPAGSWHRLYLSRRIESESAWNQGGGRVRRCRRR